MCGFFDGNHSRNAHRILLLQPRSVSRGRIGRALEALAEMLQLLFVLSLGLLSLLRSPLTSFVLTSSSTESLIFLPILSFLSPVAFSPSSPLQRPRHVFPKPLQLSPISSGLLIGSLADGLSSRSVDDVLPFIYRYLLDPKRGRVVLREP